MIMTLARLVKSYLPDCSCAKGSLVDANNNGIWISMRAAKNLYTDPPHA